MEVDDSKLDRPQIRLLLDTQVSMWSQSTSISERRAIFASSLSGTGSGEMGPLGSSRAPHDEDTEAAD
ncbi:TPA: hypothetical protein DCE37_05500 [Candidatus Latescibacteria bacterium]|nr:hypothetical protein [Candidatus Latescibacterota bacterium]